MQVSMYCRTDRKEFQATLAFMMLSHLMEASRSISYPKVRE